jgi:hypothetical protein
MAGSAYALKPNGTLGYADTAAGEGLEGELMERCGFPALKKMGLKTIAMVYVTHNAAIAKMLADPAPFIAALLAKAKAVGIDGYDVDYEPQMAPSSSDGPAALAASAELHGSFMAFLGQLGETMRSNGLMLTIDVGGCPAFDSFQCEAARGIQGLAQANCMHTFGSRSLQDFKQLASGDASGLGSRWAPGFEPGNMKANDGHAFQQVTQYLNAQNVSHLATWEVHEMNLGVPQPQWLFDAVNSFLDGGGGGAS